MSKQKKELVDLRTNLLKLPNLSRRDKKECGKMNRS